MRSVFFITLLLTSCTISSIHLLTQQESALKTRGGYGSYLALEYLQFSRSLLSVKEKKTAEYFSKKGLGIASGVEFVPENPIEWKADPAQVEEMVM
ncbi:MAG: hypothetical protein FJX34_01690, partial [Alphaproteobacteria bacterium]|nr:hypothetical protein [Alphaproteobacteria bacterium]